MSEKLRAHLIETQVGKKRPCSQEADTCLGRRGALVQIRPPRPCLFDSKGLMAIHSQSDCAKTAGHCVKTPSIRTISSTVRLLACTAIRPLSRQLKKPAHADRPKFQPGIQGISLSNEERCLKQIGFRFRFGNGKGRAFNSTACHRSRRLGVPVALPVRGLPLIPRTLAVSRPNNFCPILNCVRTVSIRVSLPRLCHSSFHLHLRSGSSCAM